MKIGTWKISARNFSEPIRCVVAEIYSKKNLIGFSYRTIDYRSVFLIRRYQDICLLWFPEQTSYFGFAMPIIHVSSAGMIC